jgi:hypothetical protein
VKKINLDPRKLLGFKIVASQDASMALLSPKIGGKVCVVGDVPLSAGLEAKPLNTGAEV